MTGRSWGFIERSFPRRSWITELSVPAHIAAEIRSPDLLRWAQRGAHLRGNSGPVESFRSAAEPIPAAATREARGSPGDLAFSKPSRAPHRAQFYGAGVQGAQKVPRHLPAAGASPAAGFPSGRAAMWRAFLGGRRTGTASPTGACSGSRRRRAKKTG